MTPRACLIGIVLTVLFAVVVPWNDWQLRNTLLFNNYLPPLVTLVLIAAGVALNPLLGRARLRRDELVVIAMMLLGLGGVASSGLARYFPTYLGMSTEAVATRATLEPMQLPLPDDGDPTTADWRWTATPGRYVAMPDRGPVDRSDPEHRHVIGGFLYGSGEEPGGARVAHRSRVGWRVEPGGEVHGPLEALAGRVAAERRVAGEAFLDLESGTGAHLARLRLGESVLLPADRTHTLGPGEDLAAVAERYYQDATAAGALARANGHGPDAEPIPGTVLTIPDRATITAIEAPGVPWYAWAGPLLSWAPLLLGAMVAMVAVAGIVRKQWMEHERLPYPIASVTLTLLEDPEGQGRLAPIFRDRRFWIGLVIAAGVIGWKGLYAYGLVPITIATRLDLGPIFRNPPFDQVLVGWSLINAKVYFSVIAICFFISLELSFSLWAFYLIMQFGTMGLRASGVPVAFGDVAAASGGGFVTMCALILWIGRRYYWALLRAAFTFRKDEETAEAVPYVWALLAGVVVMVVSLVMAGAPVGAAFLVVLLMLGLLLVLARMVAEAGIPFVCPPMGAGFSVVMLNLVGFGLPAGALLPLSVIGSVLMDDPRESLLPYAVNAGFLGKRAGVPIHRGNLALLAAAAIGGVIAVGAMIAFAYGGTGAMIDSYAPGAVVSAGWSEPAAMAAAGASTESMAAASDARVGWLTSAGFGGVLVALLGVARMYVAAWPLHPIGFLTMLGSPTAHIWFSFLLGWLCKLLVMRYGGPALFARLKPVAIGLIAGEALGAGTFAVVKIIGLVVFDADVPRFDVLPR